MAGCGAATAVGEMEQCMQTWRVCRDLVVSIFDVRSETEGCLIHEVLFFRTFRFIIISILDISTKKGAEDGWYAVR